MRFTSNSGTYNALLRMIRRLLLMMMTDPIMSHVDDPFAVLTMRSVSNFVMFVRKDRLLM